MKIIHTWLFAAVVAVLFAIPSTPAQAWWCPSHYVGNCGAGYIVGRDIPPKRYDHKYYGKTIIKYIDDDEPSLQAFTYGDTGGFCVIYVNRRRAGNIPLSIILRHERGHCNGWPASHGK